MTQFLFIPACHIFSRIIPCAPHPNLAWHQLLGLATYQVGKWHTRCAVAARDRWSLSQAQFFLQVNEFHTLQPENLIIC